MALTVVCMFLGWDDGKALQQPLGLGAPVWFRPADHHIDAFLKALVSRVEHRERLADPRSISQKELQFPAGGAFLRCRPC